MKLAAALSIVLAVTAVSTAAAGDATPETAPGAAGSATPVSDADKRIVQDVLYIAAKRPMFLRFRIQIDGRGFLALREEFAESMFRSLDKDGDGVLNGEEASGVPSVLQLAAPNDRETLRLRGAVPDADGDGKVTIDELMQFVGLAAGSPFEIVAETPRSRARTNLFSRLDANGDGALTAAELEAGRRVISREDINDDEMISAAELNPDPQVRQTVVEESAVRSLTSLMFVIDRNHPSDATIRKLLQLYDRFSRDEATGFFSKNGQLSAAELGVDASVLAASDADGDGQLTAVEMRGFLKDPPPDVELDAQLRLSERHRADFKIATPPAGPAAEVLEASQIGAGRVTVTLGGIKADLDPAVDLPSNMDLAAQFTQLFELFDGDNNDYLDATEFNNLGVSFPAVDVDRDQKIFLKELLAYLDIQASLAKTRTALIVSNESKTLFDMLDGDADGRLAQRELNRAQSRLEAWDADANGRVAVEEIPSNYRMQFAVGRPVSIGPPFALQQGTQAAVPRPTSGPLWFRKMDRNVDGDVSQREFLGPLDVFTQLDADGDGLLDAAEAATADR